MKQLKNITLLLIFSIVTLFGSMEICDAANASVSITSSASQLVVGNNVTYKVTVSSSSPLGVLNYSFNYDTSKLTLVDGTLNAVPYFTGTEKSATYTFVFKAKARGSATVSFTLNEAIDFDGTAFNVQKTTSKTVNIITQEDIEKSYSTNNYLSSLKVDNYNITPDFNKDKSDYTLTVENNVRSINISGTKEDSKSSVTGLGNHDLSEGANKIEIKVTAQNGSTRTYTITVTVKELTPVEVEIDGKKMNVERKRENLTSPNSTYEETTIKINNEDIPAFINTITDVTLVGLKDELGNINLYMYKDGSYSLYNEFSSNKITITEASTNNPPEGYKKVELTIDEKKITAYQKKQSSNYYLVYATNIENGLTSWYQYDSKEKTFQLVNKDFDNELSNMKQKNKYYEYMIVGLGIILAVTYVSILVSTVKKDSKKGNKKKKKYDDFKEHFDKDELANDDLDDNIETNEDTISLKKEKTNNKKK